MLNFIDRKLRFWELRRCLKVELCALHIASFVDSFSTSEAEDLLQPMSRFRAEKYFYGYLIGFILGCGFRKGLRYEEIKKLVINVLKSSTKLTDDLNFMKLCLLEFELIKSLSLLKFDQFKLLNPTRTDIQDLRDGASTGLYDANLMITSGFPSGERVASSSLGGCDWDDVHFPLLREYLLTGKKHTERELP